MIEFQLLQQIQQLADGDNTDRRQSAILRWQILREVKRPNRSQKLAKSLNKSQIFENKLRIMATPKIWES